MLLSMGHAGDNGKVQPYLLFTVLVIVIAPACGTPSQQPASPAQARGPNEKESHAQPGEPETKAENVQAETEKVQTKADPEAQLVAELKKKAASAPDILIGRARVTYMLCCGGVAPLEDKSCYSTSLYHGDILIRKGEKNSTDEPVAVAKADEQGIFSASLPEGKYCLVVASKKNKPAGPVSMHENAQCLVEEWESCDAIIEHPLGAPVFIELSQPCFGPCYQGPLPPSSAP